MRYGLCARKLNDAVAAPAGASAAPLASVSPMVAVYVPTNNLYLGDIVICERERASFPNITVEEGIRIFLTGGTAMPPRLRNV